MKIASGFLFGITVLFSLTVFPQVQSLRDGDSILAAKLSATELRQIVAVVEHSAYDTPDSWTEELRAKRVDLGSTPGLIKVPLLWWSWQLSVVRA